MKRGLAILGSTGSIGSQTLALVRSYPDKFHVVSLAAGKNIAELRSQIAEFRPEYVSVADENELSDLKAEFPGVMFGYADDGITCCIEPEHVDIVVVAMVGFSALKPTLQAISVGKTIALANKEALVVAGNLVMEAAAKSYASIIPVDSEHNAIYQLIQNRSRAEIARIILTASGGPFFRQPEINLDTVTPEMAIAHPNWKMGPKISVDSATLMNKGLELIEAHYLFDVKSSQIDIWVHPQSILHGAIRLTDNTFLAQLSKPDMRSAIAFALYPERLPNVLTMNETLPFRNLEFFDPDLNRFPCLRLARHALDAGPSFAIALNAANEVAVDAFLNHQVKFTHIPVIVEKTLAAHAGCQVTNLESIVCVDELSRSKAQQVIHAISC